MTQDTIDTLKKLNSRKFKASQLNDYEIFLATKHGIELAVEVAKPVLSQEEAMKLIKAEFAEVV